MSWKPLETMGWGRASAAFGDVARPERVAHLKKLLSLGAMPAFGMRRSYGDAPLTSSEKSLDMTRLDRVLDFDAATGLVHVEAGLPIGDLGRMFAAQDWLPPVSPGTGFATIGGCIANDVHGKNHHVVGSFGQHVTEITLIQGDKTRVITPNDSAEFQATVGGLGQTGVIASAKIQMMPCKGDLMVLTERRIDDLDEFFMAFEDATKDFTVGWIDATAKGDRLGRGVLEEGEITSGVNRSSGKTKSVPFNAPAWALSAPIVRLFNELYFRRVPRSGRTSVKPITDPFFPLDAIHNWNRLYGKAGFNQFQCVVPLNAKDSLREMLERISASGLASPLAVLKKMGAGRAGYMSFPMEGYTLAVDFPNRGAADYLIRDLTNMAREAGGRIYFAKDGVAKPQQIDGMYPDQDAWRKVVNEIDPTYANATNLVTRLNLRGPAPETKPAGESA
ncbi:decaprenylphospho-beta-D-ribofuranose 2-oxidase [Pacificibacter maritimus]|uniref:Decaprenylphospho-beta-D-ribofuranose 2-oxidase n=1 Tax=Pacificibacter maritimus TaxID=762213 RepID=A0A3N4UF26_9RHOB|nr:FAD-binding oxidoreductase [Pacificibacter maritimus]RPE67065.1 decaprenylphospho-beta-D-ribofuranose 2-oxidase [Pacificibacter maritimus]